MKIVVASNNPGKLIEIQAILAGAPFELLLPQDLGYRLEVEEVGLTYAENARLKALAHAQKAGLLAMADDSGLEVEALGGAPGLHSARYHPKPGANDADRRTYLLQNLAGLPRPWPAHFHCTVAIANPDGQVWFAGADCPGEIIPQERGQNGFGYDPIFWLPQLGHTMAELTMEQKNQLSHRALAVRAALPVLLRLSAGQQP